MAPGDIIAKAEHVFLRRGSKTLLENVSVAVEAGRIITVVGPNGSGKTTLVRVLLGLMTPDSGSVWLRPSLRVGYMPQRMQVDPVLPITVSRFLTLGGRANTQRLHLALETTGTGELADRPMQALSGGELQRVLLARAILREPELLILDEPVQGVDVIGQNELYELISQVRDTLGCGVLMVSHDLHLVMAATDHVVCLDRHVCCSGHPEVVTQDPAYLELFGEHVADKLALYTHRHDHRHDHGSPEKPAAKTPESRHG
ncbi:MAG: zinc ABC transporter ATP-binding protein ZnuC [Gammaproteobacteria bacterium]|nr:MAG: zinc ABC transporter ATP-binding protein ZnuC [Gammaproteobacteria bacterium]